MPTKILSAALTGLDASLVSVEADAGGGDFGQITIVGLPDSAVSEARERVRSVLRNCGLSYPHRKITVNLAPANLKKHGSGYDLPIAVSVLALQNKFYCNFNECLIIGELSLSGEVQSVSGVLSMADAANQNGLKNIFVPAANAAEAKLIKNLAIFPVKNLKQLINHFQKRELITPFSAENINDNRLDIADEHQSIADENRGAGDKNQNTAKNSSKNSDKNAGRKNQTAEATTDNILDLSQIKGQEKAKRALEIAAAGGHNLLLFGPPGSGKTLLANTLPNLLPPPTFEEKLEITKIYSAAGLLKDQATLIDTRPFRAPHHSASALALIGGGTQPRPGEISLAHRGVLFLDEFPEFSHFTLENLRQPLEDGAITVSRATVSLKFPAKFMLVAAMNPCPCGYAGDKNRVCRCDIKQLNNYRRRLSGPIIDRIDLHVEAPKVEAHQLDENDSGETSREVKKRIAAARVLQNSRFKNQIFLTNAEITNATLKKFCPLDAAGRLFLNAAATKLNLSARAYFRILKLARTIADLGGEKDILIGHLAEALQYRPKLG